MFEIQHVAGMVDKALVACCTPLNIRKGFAATGISPVNSDIFTDDDFLAASISGENRMAEEFTRTASDVARTSTASTSAASTSVDFRSILGDIGPVQIAAPRKKSNRGRKPTKSTILTSPEKRSEMQQKADNRAKKGSKAKPSPRKGKSSKQPKDQPAKKQSRHKYSSSPEEAVADLCPKCNEVLPKNLSRNNSIYCNTCDTPYHLKCVNMGRRSYFTCEKCDSDMNSE